MRLNRVSWGAVALAVLAAAFAPAAFAPAAFADGNPKNGLSRRAFGHNALTANPKALGILLKHALNKVVDEPYISRQLHDPMARAVMKELVKCALDRWTVVTYVDSLDVDPHDGPIKHQWRGELGLCQHDQTTAGNWSKDKPTKQCQQLSTACLLARENVRGKAIPISFRGQPPVLSPRDEVRTETTFREGPAGEITLQGSSEGTPIGSFSGPVCAKGHEYECNWAPAYVGKCDGGSISLAIQDPSACRSTALRVCAGIHGCYGANSGYSLPAGFPKEAPYSRHIEDKTGACAGSPIEFACPTEPPIGGYYSVMTRPITGVFSKYRPIVIKVAGSGTYPATEKEAFTFREGAFYGNLFKPGELMWSCEVGDDFKQVCKPTPGNEGAEAETSLPYKDVYACYTSAQQKDSEGEKMGAAYLNNRICDRPDLKKGCFFHKPNRCYYTDPETNEKKGAHCKWVSDAGFFQDCHGQGDKADTTYQPITMYLNDPCHLIDDKDLCTAIRKSIAIRKAIAPVPGGVPKVPPGPRGRGGCSLDAAGGTHPASIAVLLGLLLHRRRRRRGG
jgi:hypothetical protein